MESIIARESAVLAPFQRMSWGAVFAGWAVAVGFASLMYVAGLALGFSAFDPTDSAATAKGFSVATGLWMVLTWIVALFLGGMFASWFDGNNDATMGAMHGVTVWALSIVFSGLLVAAGATQVARGGTALLLGHAGSATPSAANATQSPLAALRAGLQAKLALASRQASAPATSAMLAVAATRPPSADRQAMAAATTAMLAGQVQTARDILTANTSMSPAQVDAAVADASAQVRQYEIEAKATAERVARYTALTLWVAFASSLLGMLAAALGGWLGGDRVQRVYHLRTYTPLGRHVTP